MKAVSADTGSLSDRNPTEVRADAFARHLLVPVEGLRKFLGDRRPASLADLSAVVQRFLVSPQIAAIALHEAGYVDAATKAGWMELSTPKLATRFGWSDQYRALQADSDQRRAPQGLLSRAIDGYVKEILSAQTIASLRGITAQAAETDLREAGIVPVQRPVPWVKASDLPDVEVDWAALDADLNAPDPEDIFGDLESETDEE